VDVEGRRFDAARPQLAQAAIHVLRRLLGGRAVVRKVRHAPERVQHPSLATRAQLHARSLGNRRGEHETVVVVGVLAQQVHAPGGFAGPGHSMRTSTA
jgi:hypothetical protein